MYNLNEQYNKIIKEYYDDYDEDKYWKSYSYDENNSQCKKYLKELRRVLDENYIEPYVKWNFYNPDTPEYRHFLNIINKQTWESPEESIEYDQIILNEDIVYGIFKTEDVFSEKELKKFNKHERFGDVGVGSELFKIAKEEFQNLKIKEGDPDVFEINLSVELYKVSITTKDLIQVELIVSGSMLDAEF